MSTHPHSCVHTCALTWANVHSSFTCLVGRKQKGPGVLLFPFLLLRETGVDQHPDPAQQERFFHSCEENVAIEHTCHGPSLVCLAPSVLSLGSRLFPSFLPLELHHVLEAAQPSSIWPAAGTLPRVLGSTTGSVNSAGVRHLCC